MSGAVSCEKRGGADTPGCGFDPGSRLCARHGPALRKGRPWWEKNDPGYGFGGKGLSSPLPTSGARRAQVLRSALAPAPADPVSVGRRENVLHRQAVDGDPVALWLLKVAGALSAVLPDEAPKRISAEALASATGLSAEVAA